MIKWGIGATVSAATCIVVAGCFSPSNTGSGADASFPGEDGSAGFDGASDDVAAPDATTPDSSLPPVDASVQDSGVVDAGVHDASLDTTLVDSSVPEAGPDGVAVDAGPEAGADAMVEASADAAADVVDASSALDAGGCVVVDGGILNCDVITVGVANPGGALTAYTVPIVLDTRPYVAAGKMMPDCSDLAAYGPDGQTPLPYWVSTAECNTATTRLFVQVPSLPSGGGTSVYFAYGSPPPLPQDGASLFLFFDDFTGSALDTSKWTHWGDGTYTEASGQLTTQHANLLVGVPSVVTAGTTAVGVRENGNSALGDDFEIGAGQVTAVTSASWLWVNSRTGTWASFVSYSSTNMTESAGSTVCDNLGPIGGVTFDGAWHDLEWRYDLANGATSASSLRSDGTALSYSIAADAGCVTSSPGPVLLGLDHGTNTGADPVTNVDWVYVRAVATPEPTVTVVPPAWAIPDGGAGDAATD